MKKILLWILLFLPLWAQGQDALSQAQAAYEKNDFAAALPLYQQASQTQKADTLYQTQLRIIACQYMLGQYLNAAQSAFSFPLPQSAAAKARLLLYRIKTAQRVKDRYRATLPDATQDNASLNSLSPQQWDEKITEAFQDLWKMRHLLIEMPIEQESFIINVKDTDTQAIPTLFDFVVLLWQEYLLSAPAADPLKAEQAIHHDFVFSAEAPQGTQLLLSILTQAAQLDGKNRADARLIWQAKKILLPFENPHLFSFENKSKQQAEAADLLAGLAGQQENKAAWWKKLLSFSDNKALYGQSYTAFESANLYNQAEEYEKAVALCRWAKEDLPENYYTSYACAELVQSITAPVLQIASVAAVQNPADLQAPLTARNIENIHVRIYRTDEEELKKLNEKTYAPWSYLKDVNQQVISAFLPKTPFKTLVQTVTYQKPYAFAQEDLRLPALTDHGFYLVLLSYGKDFDPQQAPVEGFLLNITDLALFASGGLEINPTQIWQKEKITAPMFRLYALNLKTGQPQAGADITYFLENTQKLHRAQTNENGMFTLSQTFSPQQNKRFQIAPKIKQGSDTAFLSGWFNFYYRPPAKHKVYLETDLAIYRPEQKVQLALYAFQNTARGFVTLSKGQKIHVEVRDPNYEPVFETDLTLREFGTAQSAFTLPKTGLLGNYQVIARLPQEKERFYHSFRVEEYKRPEYEVNLDPQAVLQWGKESRVTGKAQYYFGAPLTQAPVSYQVTRRVFQPRLCWWCMPIHQPDEIVATGNTQTDKEGNFELSFLAQAPTKAAASFEVEVSVRDESGRVITTSHMYKLSPQPQFFAVKFTQGFYDANTPTTLAEIALTDVNETPVSGKTTVNIYELENKLPENTPDNRASWETIYKDNKTVRLIKSQTVNLNKEYQKIQIPALPEGIYKLSLQSKQAEDTELIFLVAAQKSALALPPVAIVQKDNYPLGEKAKILIGTSALKGHKRIEITHGNFLLHKEILPAGVTVYHLPILSSWQTGTLQLQWFGASDYKIYHKHAFISVYPPAKELSLDIATTDSVKPGEKLNWTASLKNHQGQAINGQISARIYDKSLDYYAKPSWPDLTQLWKETLSGSTSFGQNDYYIYPRTLTRVQGQQPDYQPQPLMPSLNLSWRSQFYPRAMLKSSMTFADTTNTVAMARGSLEMGAASMVAAEEAALDSAAQTSGASAQAPRSDFSETAYFNAQIPVVNGKAKLQFTMPQSLTAWNISALAFTQDAATGSFTAQTVTSKDLMVRWALPRFWREEDQSTLVLQATNITDKKRTAQIKVEILLDGKNAAAAFGLEKLTQTITLPAQETVTLKWPIKVPTGVGIASLKASLSAQQDNDAELRQIPILPAKERIAESTTVSLESGTKTLQLKNLLTDDDTRKVSTVNLRIDPGLLLSVLQAMPQLVKPYHNDALSILNRYVPLAVLNGFYQAYPLLQTAVEKLPKRNTVFPAWQENQDPARLLLLEESPWLRQAQGNATQEQFLTDLFNADAVAETRQQAEQELAKYQTPSGGYSWIAGGNASEYITLNVLAGYGQALRYGAQIPTTAAQKALAWLAPKLEEKLKINPPSAANVSLALYGAYVFTAFPTSWQEKHLALVKKWLAYADQHSAFMTALGQSYAASAYHRLGEDTKAQNYLDLVLSRMKTDPVTGAYFAPEAQSWLWYNDTIATQTATLRTLLEIRPEATDKAAELVKWLLFNRKAQTWDSTTDTANAVYSLLEYMQRNGLLDDPAEYSFTWGAKKEELHFEPFDWSQPLRWTEEAENVPPAYYTAQVTKRGGLTGFATLDAVYTTASAKASENGIMNVEREYFLKYMENNQEKVRRILPQEELPVGAEIEVRLTIKTTSAFDFVVINDPKPAGFENVDLLSGWSWEVLPMYKVYRDGSTQFFLDRVPAGEFVLRYTLRPTLSGTYHVLPAQIQSMYAPQFSAHSQTDQIQVR